MCKTLACIGLFTATIGLSACGGEISGTVRLPPGVDATLSPAVVYVASSETAPPPEPAASVVVDQRNLQFVPRVQAMVLGGSIVFRNSDREAHNVNCQSDCCNFNSMVGPGREFEVRPQRPGIVGLLCNIHQQMRGFVVVCPSALFAVADPQGRFRIANVPEGTHRVVVWQEFSKRLVTNVHVAGRAVVHFELEPSGAIVPTTQANAVATHARGAEKWPAVRKQIEATLSAALGAARGPDGVKQAEQLVLDAYFRHFEASQLETAIRLYAGDQRVYRIERMFERIRKPLVPDLAAGRATADQGEAAVRELLAAIDDEIRELERRGVYDSATIAVAGRQVPPSQSVDAAQVLTELRRAFGEVERLAAAGNPSGAASALVDAYFSVFHQIEPAIARANPGQKLRLEEHFLELRSSLEAGLPPDEARTRLQSLTAEITLAVAALERGQQSGFAAAVSGFSNALVMLVREGVEALLIVTAQLMYLTRMGQPEGRRAIYAGLVAALAATLATWSALQWLIVNSGFAQEAIEGAAALVAAAVLFYVSYWLISKAEARRWQDFLARQVGRSISTGSKWALAATAFLAVYREGAETILMFQPLLVQPSPGELAGVVAGITAAVLVLAAVFFGLRFASLRMAIRPFFRWTGIMLFALSVIFAGKGVTELQEAGIMAYAPLPDAAATIVRAIPFAVRETLGVGTSIQSLIVQGMILGGAVVSLGAVWLLSGTAPSPRPAAAVARPSIAESGDGEHVGRAAVLPMPSQTSGGLACPAAPCEPAS